MPLSPSERRDLARFGAKLAALDRQVRRLRTSQGRHRSLDGGSTIVYDDDGVVRQVQGQQEDGTYTVVDLNGDTPPPVNPPTVEGRPGLLVVSSYGQPIGAASWPADFARILVHVGTSDGFDRTTATAVGEFGRDGGTIAVALDPGDYWAALVAVNTSGIESDTVLYSGPATVTLPTSGAGGVTTYRSDTEPVGLNAADDGSLWYDTNDDDRAHRWDGDALAWVPLIVGGSALAVDALDGKTITGAVIQTAASGLRWALSSPATKNTLKAYSGHANETAPGELAVRTDSLTDATAAQVRLASPRMDGGSADAYMRLEARKATVGGAVSTAATLSADTVFLGLPGDDFVYLSGDSTRFNGLAVRVEAGTKFYAYDSAYVGGTGLDVDGGTTTDTLEVSGAADVGGNLTVAGDLSVTGSFTPPAQPRINLRKIANQTGIPSSGSIYTPVTFPSLVVNEGGWGIGLNGTRVTVPEDGDYDLDLSISWEGNATNRRAVVVTLNDGGTAPGSGGAATIVKGDNRQAVSGGSTTCKLRTRLVNLSAGDELAWYGSQLSGVTLAINASDFGVSEVSLVRFA